MPDTPLSPLPDATLAPCIAAARSFKRGDHLRFVIDDTAVGWIRRDDAARLRRWPAVFTIATDAVVLAPRWASLAERSAALGDVIGVLAADGRITGWRNETFAIRNRFDDPPLALIERAASRFFGTMTYAVHVNGLIAPSASSSAWSPSASSTSLSPVPSVPAAPNDASAPSAADARPRLWIARRSADKSVDPGMLDTIVGGGIGWGWSIEETLVKECWEESGVPAALACQAARGRTLYLLAEIAEGTQAEQLFIHDLVLPADFRPVPQDGEVAEHLDLSIADALQAVIAGQMTVDASLATLECASRRGWINAVPALHALFVST